MLSSRAYGRHFICRSSEIASRPSEIIFSLYESVRRHARVSLPRESVLDNPFITMLDAGKFGQTGN